MESRWRIYCTTASEVNTGKGKADFSHYVWKRRIAALYDLTVPGALAARKQQVAAACRAGAHSKTSCRSGLSESP